MPQSPPSSPLPLPHSFDQPPINDINTKDDQRRGEDISEKISQRGRIGTASRSRNSNVGLTSIPAPKECRSCDMKRSNDNYSRPSTSKAPRPQPCSARPGRVTKACSKDAPLCSLSVHSSCMLSLRAQSTPSTNSSRSKQGFYQNTTSSELKSSSGPCKEATLTKSTRVSSLRSQTAITTTTTTITRKVASTTITLGLPHERECSTRVNSGPKSSLVRRKRLVAQDAGAIDKQDAAGTRSSDASHGVDDTPTVAPYANSQKPRAQSNTTSPLLPAFDMESRQEMESSSQSHGPVSICDHHNATAEAASAHPRPSTGPSSPIYPAPMPDALHRAFDKSSDDGCAACLPNHEKPCAAAFQAMLSITTPSAEGCASPIFPTLSTLTDKATNSGGIVAAGRSYSAANPEDSTQPQESVGYAKAPSEYGLARASADPTHNIDLSSSPLSMAKDSETILLRLEALEDQRQIPNYRNRAESGIRGYGDGNYTAADSVLCASKCMHTGGCSVHLGSKHRDKDCDRQPLNDDDNEQANDNNNDTSNDNDSYTADSSNDGKFPLKTALVTDNKPRSSHSTASAPAGITFRDKMQFLKSQELRSSSVKSSNQSVYADASKAPQRPVPGLLPSTPPHQQPQGRSRSTPTLLSDFPSSLFFVKHRTAPAFSARTLASLAPAATIGLPSSASSPQTEPALLRPKFLRPRIPLFGKPNFAQALTTVTETQLSSLAAVTTSACSKASPRDRSREPASPSITSIGKQDVAQDVDAHSPCSLSPPHLGRRPLIAEHQEQVHIDDLQAEETSILASRFANLRVMNLLCPIRDASSVQEPDGVSMNASWAAQISQLLNYLADKADLEEEERGSCLRSETSSNRLWLRVSGYADHRAPKGYDIESSGLYRQILRDWLIRLSQLSGEVLETHSGLKRDVDKIRWQHNITSASPSLLHS
ncbi:unnamed protein product [Mortierella alpina]